MSQAGNTILHSFNFHADCPSYNEKPLLETLGGDTGAVNRTVRPSAAWLLPAHTPITEAITTLAPGMPFPQAQSSRSHQDFSAFPYNRQHCASPQAQLGTFTYGSPGPRRLAVPDSPLGSISCHFCEFFRLAAKRLNLSTGK